MERQKLRRLLIGAGIGLIAICALTGMLLSPKKPSAKSTTAAASPTTAQTPAATTPPSSTAPYTLPPGYKDMTGIPGATFTFSYPTAFGNLNPTPSYDGSTSYISDTPATAYAPGMDNGMFQVFVYNDPQQAVRSNKYGPMVKLVNGKWIVDQPVSTDTNNPSSGVEYRDANNDTVQPTYVNGVAVYNFIGGDEGIIASDLRFVAHGKLVIIMPPVFDTGTYGGGPSNDRTGYDLMYRYVKESIRQTP